MFTDQNKDNAKTPSVDEIILIEKAHSERPSFSIRFRITLAFLIAFLFSFIIGLSSMIYITMPGTRHGVGTSP